MRKKIAFLVPTFQLGGMERVMSELLQYADLNTDYELHLILYSNNPKIEYEVPENVLVYKYSSISKNKLVVLCKMFLFIRKTIKNIDPDSVLSFGVIWNSLVLSSLLGLKYPIYISDRCNPKRKFSWYYELFRKLTYPLSTGYIAQTEIDQEIRSASCKDIKYTVIGNPIRDIPAEKWDARKNRIISVGRLISSKNHDHLIQIFYKIRDLGWELIIVGGNSNREDNYEKLSILIKEYGLEKQVKLLGYRKDVEKLLRESKIFAFTSTSEGFPNVLGEAMAAGLPVVSYDCIAGPKDIITSSEDGYLVENFDDIKFASYLRELIIDEEKTKSMGVKARSNVKRFSTSEICKRYFEFILKN